MTDKIKNIIIEDESDIAENEVQYNNLDGRLQSSIDLANYLVQEDISSKLFKEEYFGYGNQGTGTTVTNRLGMKPEYLINIDGLKNIKVYNADTTYDIAIVLHAGKVTTAQEYDSGWINVSRDINILEYPNAHYMAIRIRHKNDSNINLNEATSPTGIKIYFTPNINETNLKKEKLLELVEGKIESSVDKTLTVVGALGESSFIGGHIRNIASIFTNSFDPNNFTNGTIDGNGNPATAIYRIISTSIIYYPIKVKVKIPSGYHIGINRYTSANVFISWDGWKSNILEVPANTYFRFVIKKVPETTSQTLDVADTLALFSFITELQEEEKNTNYENKTYFSNDFITDYLLNGGINDNGGHTVLNYRICTDEILNFDNDINIIIPNLYRIDVHYYNSEGTLISYSGWQYGYYKIPKNSNFRIMIARYIEDSSETLNISNTIQLFKVLRNEEYQKFLSDSIQNELLSNKLDTSFIITGNFNDSGVYVQQVIRNVSTIVRKYPVDILIKIPNNYRLGILYYNTEGAWQNWGGWFTGELTIPSNKYFKLLFAKVTEVAGVILDPNEVIPLYSIQQKNDNDFKVCEEVTFEVTSRQGEVNNYPENTLIGFQEAKKMGYNHVRVSFGWTSDGIAIAQHDLYVYQSKLRDSSGNPETDQTLRFDQMTFAQVQQYDAGIYKGSEFAGTRVPTLESVLRQCKRLNQKVDIEFKFGYSEQRQLDLLKLIYTLGLQDNCLYSTGHIPSLQYIQASDYNKIQTGYIAYFTEENVNTCITNHFDRIDMFDSDTYSATVALLAHENGIKIKYGSAYNLTQATNAAENYDVIECANIKNPIFDII